jgi:cytochrome c-type biogenesis protein CcmE
MSRFFIMLGVFVMQVALPLLVMIVSWFGLTVTQLEQPLKLKMIHAESLRRKTPQGVTVKSDGMVRKAIKSCSPKRASNL